METRTVEQVEGWKSRPFTGGYAGLRELSDGEFSGAVRAGGAWLFMLNGRAIGIHEGSLGDFEDAEGTAYAAPHPSLPLLFSMQETGGETRAKYYTNDTPLSEADSTLSNGGFTGYVELSENVLSGDYYVAYYGGRSMSVAFVGASEQVLSGDEAFERAADEVGIYEVRDVDLEVIDLPEPEEPDPEPAAGKSDDSTPDPESEPSEQQSGGASAGPADSQAEPTARTSAEPTADPRAEPTADPRAEPTADATARDGADPTDDSPMSSVTGAKADAEPRAVEDSETEPSDQSEATDPTSAESSSPAAEPTARVDAGRKAAAEVAVESPSESSREATDPAGVTDPDAVPESESEQTTDDEGMFTEEAEWREATTIPSLDPDRTDSDDDAAGVARRREQRSSQSAAADETPTSESPVKRRSQTGASGRSESSGRSSARGRNGGTADRTASGGASSSEVAEANARVEELESQLREREQQVEKLESHLSKVQSQRNELKRERDALRQEVERLEAELESADSDAVGGATRRLDRSQAFDETNLFVRYRSKGEATLDDAARGEVEADDVNDNLRLEHHTQFEADDVAVDGTPFEEFLSESFEYRFSSWVVRELLYEIRDTGHRGRLRGLYEAIPRIDRVDLHGSVSAGTDAEDTRQASFDVIMRDKMGNPLVVADLNESRDPTTGEMMGALVDSASDVSQAYDDLVGAFQVTESFFAPEALETTENATSGGLLSREKRASFVKLSRKRGFHLCLVESRSGGFHLNVPEL
ncbi:DUF7527 domain-containing protein [Halorussus amylolyticus]|uniref:DUF7527 domain-containing protein n=1 Tax=Halorussus amylolyticus TaxID=1126242 RepID=UPI00104E9EB9|nr:hypothetical protein [Halorussus amylolyticus]